MRARRLRGRPWRIQHARASRRRAAGARHRPASATGAAPACSTRWRMSSRGRGLGRDHLLHGGAHRDRRAEHGGDLARPGPGGVDHPAGADRRRRRSRRRKPAPSRARPVTATPPRSRAPARARQAAAAPTRPRSGSIWPSAAQKAAPVKPRREVGRDGDSSLAPSIAAVDAEVALHRHLVGQRAHLLRGLRQHQPALGADAEALAGLAPRSPATARWTPGRAAATLRGGAVRPSAAPAQS